MGTNPVILFRTDGNSKIATGHVVRCLSVARAFAHFCSVSRSQGIDAVLKFVVSDSESSELVQRFLTSDDSIDIQIMDSADYSEPCKELPGLISLLGSCITTSGCKPVLFIDSYFVTPNYFEELAPYAHLVYLDDMQMFDYKVDMVINYDVLSNHMKAEYEKKYSLAGKRLLGERYTPLRLEFCSRIGNNIHKDTCEGNHSDKSIDSATCHILITSGGSDPCHTCLHLSKYLLNCSSLWAKEIVLEVVVGMMNPDKEELTALSQRCSQVILHENVADMAGLMSSCQLAYSAAGTTLYELCALGIPTASFVMADNQLASAKAFANSEAIPLLGDVRTDEENVFAKAVVFLNNMTTYSDQYKNTVARMQQLIDGQGSMRIAQAVYSAFFPVV